MKLLNFKLIICVGMSLGHVFKFNKSMAIIVVPIVPTYLLII